MKMRSGWMAILLVSLLSSLLVLCACDKATEKTKGDRSLVAKDLLSKAPDSYDEEIGATLDGKIKILGLDYKPKPLIHGKPYEITFYFEVLDRIDEDYQFFGHFEPSGGKHYRMRMDHYVLGGKYRTKQWRKGDIIRDRFEGKLPKGFPGSKGILWGGFYKGDRRMPIDSAYKARSDSNGRLKLAALIMDTPDEIKRKLAVMPAKSIKIDGLLNEKDWAKTPSSGKFGNLYGEELPGAETEVKLLYDDKYLYVAFTCEDKDIWTNYKKRDDPLYREETTEVMIDADGSGSTYYELQVNPVNAVYDAYFPKRRKNMDIEWDSRVRSAVHVEGSVNSRNDEDSRWTVEMAIPHAVIEDAPNNPPKPGDRWRINFYRMERPSKKGTLAAMWSPTMVGDFHTLDRFGTIVFADSARPEEKGAVTESLKGKKAAPINKLIKTKKK